MSCFFLSREKVIAPGSRPGGDDLPITIDSNPTDVRMGGDRIFRIGGDDLYWSSGVPVDEFESD